MMIELVIEDIYPSEQISPLFSTPNISIATLGVAIFFILSGAGLTLSHHNKEFKPAAFYLKRFQTILVPFYITNVIYYVVRLLFYDENWFRAILNWRAVYTVFGIDEYLHLNDVPVISTGIGEWFLGVLVIIYLLYPLFRFLMNRFPYLFFAAATSIYLVYIYSVTTNPCRLYT